MWLGLQTAKYLWCLLFSWISRLLLEEKPAVHVFAGDAAPVFDLESKQEALFQGAGMDVTIARIHFFTELT